MRTQLYVEQLEDRLVPNATLSGAAYLPVVGDWNGDGTDTIGAFDPQTATWYLRNSNSPGAPDVIAPFAYGSPGWIPVVGDWDGDGRDSIGVFDPATAVWYLKNDNSQGAPNIAPFAYGSPNWRPVTGDWTFAWPWTFTGTVKRVVVAVSGEVSIHHEREAQAMLMSE